MSRLRVNGKGQEFVTVCDRGGGGLTFCDVTQKFKKMLNDYAFSFVSQYLLMNSIIIIFGINCSK